MSHLDDLLRRWRQDRMACRREVILLEDGTPFGECMDDWQEEDFAALDSGQYRHAYLERPRGHSKTGDIGTEAVLELLLGPPGQRLYCAAADEDQARLLLEDVAGKFRRSPLLSGTVRILKSEIVMNATDSRLTVLSSDVPSAYGLRPDWIATDELSEWRRRELWDSLWTATGKRPRCRVVAIGTPGWDPTSIAREVRDNAEREDDWYFRNRGQCASWIKPEWLAQQKRTLPEHVFARLHEARWVEGAGAFLTVIEVDPIFGEIPEGDGPRKIGLDLGLSKDKTVAALVRLDSVTNLFVLEAVLAWEPRGGRKVDLLEVEDEVAALAERYQAGICVDPWQAVLLAQRLRTRGLQVKEYHFTSGERRKLFGTLLDLIRRGRLRSRPHDELRRELLGLEVMETAAGWRVDHKVGRHDDHVVALALAVSQLAARPRCTFSFCDDPTCGGFHIFGPGDISSRSVDEIQAEAEESARVGAEVFAEQIKRHGSFFPQDR